MPGVAPSALAADSSGSNASSDSVQDYLGINRTGIRRMQQKAEETVQGCMKAEGFTYTPVGLGAADKFFNASGDVDQDAFAKKYGYGVSTLIDPSVRKTSDDPNAAYVAKLNSADRKAYYKALMGNADGKPVANGAELFGGTSCQAQAIKALLGSFQSIAALQTKFSDLERRVSSNTKVVNAMKQWSGCMKDGGFSFAKDSEIQGYLSRKLGKVTKAAATGLGALTGGAAEVVDKPGLVELQKEELRIGKADAACQKKHLKIRDEIQKAEERKFIAENRAALDTFKASLSGAS